MLLFMLDFHSKQAGNQCHLLHGISFFTFTYISSTLCWLLHCLTKSLPQRLVQMAAIRNAWLGFSAGETGGGVNAIIRVSH